MSEKVYDNHHGLILIFFGSKNYGQEQNLNFSHDALQDMRIEFKKGIF